MAGCGFPEHFAWRRNFNLPCTHKSVSAGRLMQGRNRHNARSMARGLGSSYSRRSGILTSSANDPASIFFMILPR